MKKVNCILLVDDNPTTTFLHQRLITTLQLTEELLVARNGQAALEVIEQRVHAGKAAPNLILLDLHMPVMDGLAFYKKFLELGPALQTAMKVVLITAALAGRDKMRALEAGMQHVIHKPLTRDKLKAIWPLPLNQLSHG